MFLATTINYLDRIVLSVLAPVIRQDLGFDNVAYGAIITSFEWAYTLGFLAMGRLVDTRGTRIGYAVSIAWWSAAAMLHALANSAASLAVWRAMLGLGEAGNFPAAIKAVTEWFPQRDRAFAVGVFNAGTNVAAMAGPPIFLYLAAVVGWRACFLLTGTLGFFWLVVWWASYRTPDRHPRVSSDELAYIHSDGKDTTPPMGWREAFRHRQTWGFAAGKFLTDPVWRFYLYWLPLYFTDVWKFEPRQIGWVLLFIYAMADVGSLLGGWLSGALLRRGWPVARARKASLAVFAACMPLAALAVLASNPWVSIGLASLATSAHQGWSANLYTITTDLFPKPAVASVTGIGGFFGGIGGALFAGYLAGLVVQRFGYQPLFLAFGTFHLLALLAVHLLLGNFERVGQRHPVAVRA